MTFTNVKAGDKVTSVKANGDEILGVEVTVDGDAKKTAALVADQINQYTSKSGVYTASPAGSIVTIKAPTGTGSSKNGPIAVTFSDNATTTASTVAMAGGKDEEIQVQKVVLSVPFLAIVNIPALMVKTVDIVFDMEVKSSESHKDDSSQEASLDVTGKAGWGPFGVEVKIHGAVSAHQENTRSTDRSAKYHVQVQARDDGMSEGLSRVLDMLQKAIAPVSVGAAIPVGTAKIAQGAITS